MNKQYVRITKKEQISDTETLHLGYCIEGYLSEDIDLGMPIVVDRRVRNGESILGIFTTSPVKSIRGVKDKNAIVVQTDNSIYQIDYIEEPEIYARSSQN